MERESAPGPETPDRLFSGKHGREAVRAGRPQWGQTACGGAGHVPHGRPGFWFWAVHEIPVVTPAEEVITWIAERRHPNPGDSFQLDLHTMMVNFRLRWCFWSDSTAAKWALSRSF